MQKPKDKSVTGVWKEEKTMGGVLKEGTIEAMGQGLRLFSCKRADSKYFMLCRPHKVAYSSLLFKSTL